jgi:hypothetical protein
MTTDTPKPTPRYERFAGPFQSDPLPLHHPAPPMRQKTGLRGRHHEARRGVPEGRP